MTPRRPRCMALTRAGDQCRGYAADGSDFCGAHGPKVGRHTKLTPVVAAALEEAGRKGLHRGALAEVAGVDARTLYRWLEAGAADEEAGNSSIYTRLRQSLARAEAEAERAIVDAVRTAAVGVTVVDEEGEEVRVPSDWRAGAWFLERRYPDRWGARAKVEHSGDVRTGEVRSVAPTTDEAALAVARILDRAGALPGPDDA